MARYEEVRWTAYGDVDSGGFSMAKRGCGGTSYNTSCVLWVEVWTKVEAAV